MRSCVLSCTKCEITDLAEWLNIHFAAKRLTPPLQIWRTTFREHHYPDPTIDSSWRKLLPLQRKLRGYRNNDPNTRKQCCLPLSVFEHIMEQASSPISSAVANLTCGALFFGMRSCEYSNVCMESLENPRKTKILRVRNICFFNETQEMARDDPNLTKTATTVRITFEVQKNQYCHESVSMRRTNTTHCPIKTLSSITERILKYPRSSLDFPVNTIRIGRSYHRKATKDYFDLLWYWNIITPILINICFDSRHLMVVQWRLIIKRLSKYFCCH